MKTFRVEIPTEAEFGSEPEVVCERCSARLIAPLGSRVTVWLDFLAAHVAGHLAEDLAVFKVEGWARCREALVKFVSDRDFTLAERLDMAADLVRGVLDDDLEEDTNPVHCVAEGMLRVARDAIEDAAGHLR